jgi:hypothetical protein
MLYTDDDIDSEDQVSLDELAEKELGEDSEQEEDSF